MHLNIVKSKNAMQYYVLEGYRKPDGKSSTRIVRKLGTHEELLKEHADPEAWAREVVAEMNAAAAAEQMEILVPFCPGIQLEMDKRNLYNGGYLFLQSIFYRLHLDYICSQISKRRDFKFNLGQILAHLVYARILNPSSKLAAYEYAGSFLEPPKYELADVYRALEVLGEEKEYIQSALYKFSKGMGKRNDSILYYDCTNYYFEIEQEKGNLRRYGHSKENRPNPIVEMGLFMDGDGIPLAFCIHSGNTNEQKTLKPLEEQILTDFGHAKFIVCTDAGLSSTANRKFNDVGERAFITTQSIKKMKAFQKDWALSPEGWHLPGHKETFNLETVLGDEALREKYYQWIFYKEEWFNEHDIEQKYIVTFSLKYMDYQRTIRNEQIARAEKALSSKDKIERTRQSDFKRFIARVPVTKEGEVAEKTVYALNDQKIRDEEQYDGFYAVATNLDDPALDIIRINQGRWEIEECFRIMKDEFEARPVYLQRDARITAHFTTCFLSLVIYRYLEKMLGQEFTCSQIVDTLRDMKFFDLGDRGYAPVYTRTDLTDKLHEAFGFRTDYQILSKGKIKEIIGKTKKR